MCSVMLHSAHVVPWNATFRWRRLFVFCTLIWDYLVVQQFQPSSVTHFTGWAILNVSLPADVQVSLRSCTTRVLFTYPGQEQWHLVRGLSHPRVQHPGTHSLTSALRDPALTIDMFRRKLKTELFVVWFDCRRARLCDDLSLIVRFEMYVITGA